MKPRPDSGAGRVCRLRDDIREVEVIPIVFGKPVFDRHIRRSRTDRNLGARGGGEGKEAAVLRRRCGADRQTADQDGPVTRLDTRNVVFPGPGVLVRLSSGITLYRSS